EVVRARRRGRPRTLSLGGAGARLRRAADRGTRRMTEPLETARALGFSTVVAGVRLPFCAMNASGSAAPVDEIRALRRSRTGAIVLKSATVHPFVHPAFRSLHNPGFDKLLPLVRELSADRNRPVIARLAATAG